MANELGAAQLAGVIQEKWLQEVIGSQYDAQVSDKCMFVVPADVKNKGDIVHIVDFPSTLTVQNVGSDGTVSNMTAITLGDTSLTVNQWKHLTTTFVDKDGGIQSFLTQDELISKFGAEFGKKLGEQIDNTAFAEYANYTTNATVGSTTQPSAFSDSYAKEALQRLDEQKTPKDERSFVLAPQPFWELFGNDKFSLAYSTGLGTGTQISGPYNIPGLYGAKWYMSNQITSTGTPASYRNLLVHKNATAIAIQREPTLVVFAKTDLNQKVTSHTLYGVKTFRAANAVVIATQKT